MKLFVVSRPGGQQTLEGFATALREHAAQVELISLSACRVLPAGTILADGARVLQTLLTAAGAAARAVAARTVLLAANAWEIDEQLEQLQLCGAIERQSFFAWQQQKPGSRGAYWLHGRRSGVRRMTVPTRVSKMHQTARYCAFGGDLFLGLPNLLVRYLNAESQALPG